MFQAAFVAPWPAWVAGPAIGLCGLAMYYVLNRPLGVSTGLGSVWGLTGLVPAYRTGSYREGWHLAFLVGIVLGGFLAAQLAGGDWPTTRMGRFDDLVGAGLAAKAPVFLLGGTLLGYGARLAGGCTSGHCIAGVALLAPSSLVATACFMAGAALVVNVLGRVLGV